MTDGAHRVLVTDAGRGSAVAVIRSLGRLGWHVVAASADRRSAGFRSRFAAERVVYPDPLRNPEAALERLVAVTANRGIELVIPVTEDIGLPISRGRHRFAPGVRIALPEAEAFEQARDKDASLDLARRLGIPTPRTWRLRDAADVEVVVPQLSWPVVVKPIESRLLGDDGTRVMEVSYAADAAGLRRTLEAMPSGGGVLLQEFCVGVGEGVELLADRGRVLEAFQHRRIHEVPITGGASAYRESVTLDPELLRYSAALMEALSWTGVAMVEFKVGPAGPRLMEINPRLWGSLPLAVASGVDFPARMAALHLGLEQPAKGPTAYPAGVRARNLSLDLHWVAAVLVGSRRHPFLPVPRRRAALAGFIDIVRHPRRSDLYAADDLQPQLAELGALVGRLFRTRRARRR